MKKSTLLILILPALLAACAPLDTSARVSSARASQNEDSAWGITPLPVIETPGSKDQPLQANLAPEKTSPSNGCFEGDCHRAMLTEAGQYLHDPFAQGLCAPCHQMPDDHNVNNRPHVATQQDIDLCFSCHEKDALGRSHPVDEDRIDPVTGGLLTCTSTCHNPHNAPFPAILRYPSGGSLCVRCHEEFN